MNIVGGTLDESKLRKRYVKALEKAGLTKLRFHDLRHTVGTLAVQIWRLTDVQGYMGHSNIQTMRYIHHKPEHDAAQKLSALSENLPTSPDSTPDKAI